jgi:hypothetical protein
MFVAHEVSLTDGSDMCVILYNVTLTLCCQMVSKSPTSGWGRDGFGPSHMSWRPFPARSSCSSQSLRESGSPNFVFFFLAMGVMKTFCGDGAGVGDGVGVGDRVRSRRDSLVWVGDGDLGWCVVRVIIALTSEFFWWLLVVFAEALRGVCMLSKKTS